MIISSGRYEEICAIINPKIAKSSTFGQTKVFEMIRYIVVKEYMDEIRANKQKIESSNLVAKRHWSNAATEYRSLSIRRWFKEFMECGSITVMKSGSHVKRYF